MSVLLHYGHRTPGSSSPSRRDASGFDDLIIVLPTKRRIRHLTREVIRSVGPVTALPFHTLESLARLVYTALEGTPRLMGGSVQTLLYDAAVKDVVAELRYFKVRGPEKQLFRGTFEKIIDVLNALKESGVYPPMLREEAAAASAEEVQKLQDMAAIYEAYERQLVTLNADDVAGMYRFISFRCTQPQFDRAFRQLYPAVTSVSLAGFDEFTQPEISFIRKLCAVPTLAVSLLFDFLPGNEGLFGHLQENYRMFRDLGFTDPRTLPERDDIAFGIPSPAHSAHVRAAVQHCAQQLFNSEFEGPKEDLSDHVTMMRASSRTQEIELICKLIKRLVVERPERDLSAICVAMARPQIYTDIIREQFPRFGIPVNITDRFELSRSPLVTAILLFLQVPLNGFRRDDVLRAVQTPYCEFIVNGKALRPSTLEIVSRKLRIVAGYNTWITHIEKRRSQLRHMRELKSDRSELLALEDDVRLLDEAEADIRLLEELTREVVGELTPVEFRRRLLRLIDRLGIPQRLVAPSVLGEGDLMEKDVKAYARLREVLDDMISLLEFQHGLDTTHPLRLYVDQLSVAVTKERYNIREQFGQGVLVTSIEETRGLPLDVMIVAGLVDGEFPSVYQPEVFFSARRQALREQRHSWQNRYLFYQAVTNWNEHLYLSYPERDDDLDLVRSPFLDAMLKIARMEEWTSLESVPFGPDLSSPEEFLRWCGTHSLDAERQKDVLPPSVRPAFEEVSAAIDVERSRLENHRLPQFEGIIGDALLPAAREHLETMRSRVYSASQLETYGQCPYKFFAGRLLYLAAVGPFEEDLTPLERGAILHEALFQFYLQRRLRGLPRLAECSEEEFEQAVRDLTQITEAKLAAVDIPDPFWGLEKELILGGSGSVHGLLRTFLETERSRADRAYP
jgi:ATP-dependent helicase/nuclease subunit B